MAVGLLNANRTPPAARIPPTEYTADDDRSSRKVKFLCSFGGKITPRQSDGALGYVGGLTRIIAVRRDSTFNELCSKMEDAYGCPVLIYYQLPDQGLDNLVCVSCVEDMENMMEEYDHLSQASGNRSAKLRVFLSSRFDTEREADSDDSEPDHCEVVNRASAFEADPEAKMKNVTFKLNSDAGGDGFINEGTSTTILAAHDASQFVENDNTSELEYERFPAHLTTPNKATQTINLPSVGNDISSTSKAPHQDTGRYGLYPLQPLSEEEQGLRLEKFQMRQKAPFPLDHFGADRMNLIPMETLEEEEDAQIFNSSQPVQMGLFGNPQTSFATALVNTSQLDHVATQTINLPYVGNDISSTSKAPHQDTGRYGLYPLQPLPEEEHGLRLQKFQMRKKAPFPLDHFGADRMNLIPMKTLEEEEDEQIFNPSQPVQMGLFGDPQTSFAAASVNTSQLDHVATQTINLPYVGNDISSKFKAPHQDTGRYGLYPLQPMPEEEHALRLQKFQMRQKAPFPLEHFGADRMNLIPMETLEKEDAQIFNHSQPVQMGLFGDPQTSFAAALVNTSQLDHVATQTINLPSVGNDISSTSKVPHQDTGRYGLYPLQPLPEEEHGLRLQKFQMHKKAPFPLDHFGADRMNLIPMKTLEEEEDEQIFNPSQLVQMGLFGDPQTSFGATLVNTSQLDHVATQTINLPSVGNDISSMSKAPHQDTRRYGLYPLRPLPEEEQGLRLQKFQMRQKASFPLDHFGVDRMNLIPMETLEEGEDVQNFDPSQPVQMGLFGDPQTSFAAALVNTSQLDHMTSLQQQQQQQRSQERIPERSNSYSLFSNQDPWRIIGYTRPNTSVIFNNDRAYCYYFE